MYSVFSLRSFFHSLKLRWNNERKKQNSKHSNTSNECTIRCTKESTLYACIRDKMQTMFTRCKKHNFFLLSAFSLSLNVFASSSFRHFLAHNFCLHTFFVLSIIRLHWYVVRFCLCRSTTGLKIVCFQFAWWSWWKNNYAFEWEKQKNNHNNGKL